jgi:hypothetical protein
MRKILLSGGLLTLLSIMVVGCLKDEEFEDQQYGLQVPNVNGVSFPERLKSPLVKGVLPENTSQEVEGPLLSLNVANAPSAPVTIALAIDDALVAAEDSTLELMPAGSYSVNTLNVTVPAGSITSDAIKITIPDATILDPTKKYGIGFKITSADQGYTVAKNLSTMVIAIAIRNIYEGEYHSTGYLYHPSAPRDIDEDKDVLTVNATTSIVSLGDLGGNDYYVYLEVDPATNAVTITPAPGHATPPITMFTTGLPTSNPGYTAAWPGSADSNNTYDPATKTFKLRYGYLGGTGWRVSEEHITLK